jgi:cytochrome c556
MRTADWMLLVGAALFISGIAFIIAGARNGRTANTAEAAVAMMPVASISQIMSGMVAPAATVVYDSVATTVSAAGVEEKVPRTDAEWTHVAINAAMLAEAGNLLIMNDRAVDDEDWVRISKQLTAAAARALKAAQDRSPDGIIDAGGAINETCDGCHAKYQRQ